MEIVIYLLPGRAVAHAKPLHIAEAVKEAGFAIVQGPRRQKNGGRWKTRIETLPGALCA